MCLLYSKLQGNLSTFFEVGTPLVLTEGLALAIT